MTQNGSNIYNNNEIISHDPEGGRIKQNKKSHKHPPNQN